MQSKSPDDVRALFFGGMDMKLMESVKICHENADPWDFDGLFLQRDDTVKFCYREGKAVVALSREGEREIWYTAPEDKHLPVPSCWTNACPGYCPLVDRRMEIDRSSEIYYYGDRTISQKSPLDYVCKQHGEEVWSFQSCAWRHSEIEKYGGNIYFGTVGEGGGFCLLDLRTGELLLDLKTGGTVNIYARRDERLYLLRQAEQAQLVCVDLNDGKILESLALPGVVNEACAIKVIGDTVHAVTMFYEGDTTFSHACWHRVER